MAQTIQTPSPQQSVLVKDFKAARRVSTPLVAVTTPDPAAAVDAIARSVNGSGSVLVWDVARGLRPFASKDEAARQAFNLLPEQSCDPVAVLIEAERSLQDSGVLIMLNLHRTLDDIRTPAIQAVWNLRDAFKVNNRMLVAVGISFTPPPELASDIYLIDEPLPSADALKDLVYAAYANTDGVTVPASEETVKRAVEALSGLAMFPAEQSLSLSMTAQGVAIDPLWKRKRKAIEQTRGLKVWHGDDDRFEDLRGIDSAKRFMERMIESDAFGAIVFLDEMDKSFAGGLAEHTGDSGVAKDALGVLLSYIEDTQSTGVLLAGVAGTGKTQLVKAAGAAAGRPVIVFDMGGMRTGTVGESESSIRAALKVVSATANGRVLFVGTANKTTQFTPELNRRFADQFFFDLPDDSAREAIWPVYIKKFGLTAKQALRPDGFAAQWTGAEIRRACARAALWKCSLVEASQCIVPSAVSGRAAIAALRADASGRFLSASYPGVYQSPEARVVPETASRQTASRRVSLEE